MSFAQFQAKAVAACRPSLKVKSDVAKLPVQRVRTKLLASRYRPVTSACSAGTRGTSQNFLRGDRDIPAFRQVDCSFARLDIDDIKAGVPRLKSQQRHGHSRKLPAFVQQRHPAETRERARLQAGRRHQQYKFSHRDSASGRESTSQHAEGLLRVTGNSNRAKVATCERSKSTTSIRQRTPQLQVGMGEGSSR